MSLTNPVLIALRPRVAAHESAVLRVYDDATGQRIVPGSVVKGHPTIGIGRALDTKGISMAQAQAWLDEDLEETYAALLKRLPPWFATLDPVRQGVLVEAAFQMGVDGLLAFKNTLAAIGRGDYDTAARGMLDSRWAKQTPRRVKTLAEIMRTGVDDGRY